MMEEMEVPWSKHRIFSDNLIVCLLFASLMTSMVKFSFGAVLGRCRLDLAEHLCDQVRGA
jgi:hypothetical protein